MKENPDDITTIGDIGTVARALQFEKAGSIAMAVPIEKVGAMQHEDIQHDDMKH